MSLSISPHKDMAYIYVAQMGLQPSAIAIKIKTLYEQGISIQAVWLALSPELETRTQPFLDWLQKFSSEIKSQSFSQFHELLHQIQLSEAPLLLDADAGRAKDLAQLILSTQPEKTWILHAEKFDLLVEHQNQSQRFSLSNLGIDTLLQLYQLEQDTVEPESLQADLFNSFTIEPNLQKGFKLKGFASVYELAFERAGRLYLLYGLYSKAYQGSLSESPEQTQIRNILSQQNFKGLRPQLGLYWRDCIHWQATSDTPSERMQAILDRLYFLCIGHQATFLADLSAISTWLKQNRESHRLLLTSLGNDPSATLAALAFHQPEHAWIIYDTFSADVVKQQQGLERLQNQLTTKLSFIQSHYSGKGLRRKIETLLNELNGPEFYWRVDIGPGSKIQSRILTQIVQQTPNQKIELWGLDYPQKQCQLIFPHRNDKTSDTELQPVPLEYYIAMLNTRQAEKERNLLIDRLTLPINQKFLEKLSWLMHNEVNQQKQAYNLRTLSQDRIHLIPELSQKVKEEVYQIKTTQKKFNFYHTPPVKNKEEISGLWFEYVVFYRLLAAGLEIWPNLETYYPNGSKSFELDLVAAWSDRLLSISCKSVTWESLCKDSQPDLLPPKLQDYIFEIAMVSREAFGRKAIPILVVPYAPPEMKEQVQTTLPGILLWSLHDLTPTQLQTHLEYFQTGRRQA